MRPGKVTQNVLKRSVLKQIKNKRVEVITGAGAATHSAVFEVGKDEVALITSDPVTYAGDNMEIIAVNTVVNDIAAAGGHPIGILINLLLPEDFEESELKNMMKKFNSECERIDIQIMGGHTEITDAVIHPVAVLTAIGNATREGRPAISRVMPGYDIVMSKYAGLEGTYIELKNNYEMLSERFQGSYLEKIEQFCNEFSVINEAKAAMENDVCYMHDVSEGGIYGALWELGAAAGLGLEVEFKKIPIKQETIEVTELTDVNPYQIASGGSLLMITKNGKKLVEALTEKSINASIIGRMTDNNDRVILTGEGKRFLESN